MGKQVVVEVHPCRVKEGVALGTGHLLASDVAAMSQEPASKFLFQYLTSAEHVSALGLHLPSPLGVPSTSGAASNPAHPTPPFHSDIEAAHGPANSFLRRANSLLLSLLTPAQKLQFLSALYDSPSLAPLLSTGVKDDLNTATLRLTAEILAEAPPRGTFPTPVSATSLPANDTPSFNPASRLPAAALATTRRASPIDTTSGLHLRPPPIRSPSKPVRIGSPRKSPLSVHVSTEQAADGVEVSGGEAARKEVLGAEGEGSKEN